MAKAGDGGAQQIDRLILGTRSQVAIQRALQIFLIAIQIASAQQQRSMAVRVARQPRTQKIAEQAVVRQPAGAARNEQAMTLDLVEQRRRVAGIAQRLAAPWREILQHAGVLQEAQQLGIERQDHLLDEVGVNLGGVGLDQH